MAIRPHAKLTIPGDSAHCGLPVRVASVIS
jgi:hypothetical protein